MTKLVALILAGLVLAVAAPAANAHVVAPGGPGPCDGPEDPFNLVLGSPAPDHLVGTECNDAMFGRRGADVINGKLGYDLLHGGRGPDRLVDTSFLVGGEIHGGRGVDTCVVVANTLVELFSCENVIELSE